MAFFFRSLKNLVSTISLTSLTRFFSSISIFNFWISCFNFCSRARTSSAMRLKTRARWLTSSAPFATPASRSGWNGSPFSSASACPAMRCIGRLMAPETRKAARLTTTSARAKAIRLAIRICVRRYWTSSPSMSTPATPIAFPLASRIGA